MTRAAFSSLKWGLASFGLSEPKVPVVLVFCGGGGDIQLRCLLAAGCVVHKNPVLGNSYLCELLFGGATLIARPGRLPILGRSRQEQGREYGELAVELGSLISVTFGQGTPYFLGAFFEFCELLGQSVHIDRPSRLGELWEPGICHQSVVLGRVANRYGGLAEFEPAQDVVIAGPDYRPYLRHLPYQLTQRVAGHGAYDRGVQIGRDSRRSVRMACATVSSTSSPQKILTE